MDKVQQMDRKVKSMGDNNILSPEEEVPPPHY